MNAKEMRKVANRIRKRLEKIATTLYGSTGPNLGGLCGYGSLMLHKELTELGREPQVASGCGHWFVVCDGFLVDVTASQFGQPKVVVRDYARVKEENDGNEYCRSWWNAHSVGTPKAAGVAGFQTQIDNAMALYKSRKHKAPNVVATPMAVSLGEVPSYVVYTPADHIAINSFTFIDASKKV